jgi:hypothetical protein
LVFFVLVCICRLFLGVFCVVEVVVFQFFFVETFEHLVFPEEASFQSLGLMDFEDEEDVGQDCGSLCDYCFVGCLFLVCSETVSGYFWLDF